jgi:hypothetical protein
LVLVMICSSRPGAASVDVAAPGWRALSAIC